MLDIGSRRALCQLTLKTWNAQSQHTNFCLRTNCRPDLSSQHKVQPWLSNDLSWPLSGSA